RRPGGAAGAAARCSSPAGHARPGSVAGGAPGLPVGEPPRRCRAWAARGYRPQALSVAAFPPGAGREASLAASVWHRPVVPEADLDALARRQAQAAGAVVRLGRGGGVWPLLRHGPRPRLRSYLVQRLRRLGADPLSLWARFTEETDGSIRRALLLALGEYPPGVLPVPQRARLTEHLLGLYGSHPDAGLRAAAEWLLRRWGEGDGLTALDEKLARQPALPGQGWYVNGQGQTMIVLRGPVTFWMGSPAAEKNRQRGSGDRLETLHRKRISRSFALA